MPALNGGGIPLPSCSLPDCAVLLLALRGFDRLAMSVLASVVSDGSPGSSLLILGILDAAWALVCSAEVTLDRVRGRLAGGTIDESVDAIPFLCLPMVAAVGVKGAAESSASSPEASRDDGC